VHSVELQQEIYFTVPTCAQDYLGWKTKMSTFYTMIITIIILVNIMVWGVANSGYHTTIIKNQEIIINMLNATKVILP